MTRDRTGEPVDPDASAPGDIPPHTCDRGWSNADESRPCPHCRPWLVTRPARTPTRRELARFAAHHRLQEGRST